MTAVKLIPYHPRQGGFMMRRARWTAEEYDLIERYLAMGLPSLRIGPLLDPPATKSAVFEAMKRAGIRGTRKAGRPSSADRARWDEIERKIRESG